MLKNYGLKENHIVLASSGKALILQIFNSGKNNLGFKHALIKYLETDKEYLTGLKNLKKIKICNNCKDFDKNICIYHGLKIGKDDTCKDWR